MTRRSLAALLLALHLAFASGCINVQAALEIDEPRVEIQEGSGAWLPGHGLSAERLGRLTHKMQDYIDAGDIAGVVMLAHRGGGEAYASVQGYQDRAAGTPMQRDTIFRIYSMSKPIAAVAILILVEEGKIRLGDPVARYLPELADVKVMRDPAGSPDDVVDPKRQMLIRDLLTHTCGVPYEFTAPPALAKAIRENGPASGLLRTAPPDEFAKRVAAVPLLFHPGERWHYGLGLDLAGIVVERVAGMRFGEFLRLRLFAPLGMPDTGFDVPQADRGRLAVNYAVDPKTGDRVVFDHPDDSVYMTPATFESGGGGLVSTADDYLRFARMILNGGQLDGTRVLSRKSVELMTRNVLAEGVLPEETFGIPFFRGRGFGLGVQVVEDVGLSGAHGSVGKNGWGGAAGTWYFVDFEEDLTAVFMIQLMGAGGPEGRIRLDFDTLLYQAIAD